MKNTQISDFGITANGDRIRKYTLINKNGMKVEIINFGGIVTSLTAPDRNGKYEDIVLGFTKSEDYFTSNSYFFGAIIGRFANRIAEGKFILNEKNFHVNKNNGENHLHGGNEGFHTKIWDSELLNPQKIKLSYVSKDNEEGYPGELTVTVFYTLTEENALEISYEATTDQPTIINLTHHSYLNLSGGFSQEITDHELQLNADQFIPINEFSIPKEDFENVEKTPFDFRNLKTIGKDINEENEQLKISNGYDHCWVLKGKGLRTVGELQHCKSGRKIEIITDQPGIQVYTGNHLDGKFDTKTGGKNIARTGICLETQHFPDSPNRPDFPSVELKPGEKYETKTIYKFSVI
jgi:aldose 1-epimerase